MSAHETELVVIPLAFGVGVFGATNDMDVGAVIGFTVAAAALLATPVLWVRHRRRRGLGGFDALFASETTDPMTAQRIVRAMWAKERWAITLGVAAVVVMFALAVAFELVAKLG